MSSERYELNVSDDNVRAALEAFLHTMNLIKDDEVVVSFSTGPTLNTVLIGKEVVH